MGDVVIRYGRQRGFKTKGEAESFAASVIPPKGKAFFVYELHADGLDGEVLGYFVKAESVNAG